MVAALDEKGLDLVRQLHECNESNLEAKMVLAGDQMHHKALTDVLERAIVDLKNFHFHR